MHAAITAKAFLGPGIGAKLAGPRHSMKLPLEFASQNVIGVDVGRA
jgi:hypothetical protein